MKPEVGLVIFDCDGVLVDSEVISGGLLLRMLGQFGLDLDFDYFRRNFLGRSFPTVARRIRDGFQIALPEDFEHSYRANLLAEFDLALRSTEGVEPVVSSLATARCVATSSSPERVRRSLAVTGLDAWFGDDVFTASEVRNGKPAPDLFLHAAERMGFSPEACLVIEDSLPGLEAGLAAGMRVMHYTGGGHLAGTDAALPDGMDGVTPFRRWADFYDKAPTLATVIRRARV